MHQVVQAMGKPEAGFILPRAEDVQIHPMSAKEVRHHTLIQQGLAEGVVKVDDCMARALEDPVLGAEIAHPIRVAVHVVIGDIEDRCHLGPQVCGCLQLEARQLEDIEFDIRGEEFQGRRSKVTANRHVNAGFSRHQPDQRCHRALAVGAGNGNDRCVRRFPEQVDVPGDAHTRFCGGHNGRFLKADAGADNQFIKAAEVIRIKGAGLNRHLRERLLQA